MFVHTSTAAAGNLTQIINININIEVEVEDPALGGINYQLAGCPRLCPEPRIARISRIFY